MARAVPFWGMRSAGRRLTGAWRVNAREHQFLRITWTGAKGHLVDALASDAEEGRGTLRKALVRRVQPKKPGVSEWGNPAPVAGRHRAEARGEPGEVKHLSSPRRGKDSASSGERKRSSPNRHFRMAGLKDRRKRCEPKPKGLGRPTGGGESPVGGRGAMWPGS